MEFAFVGLWSATERQLQARSRIERSFQKTNKKDLMFVLDDIIIIVSIFVFNLKSQSKSLKVVPRRFADHMTRPTSTHPLLSRARSLGDARWARNRLRRWGMQAGSHGEYIHTYTIYIIIYIPQTKHRVYISTNKNI